MGRTSLRAILRKVKVLGESDYSAAGMNEPKLIRMCEARQVSEMKDSPYTLVSTCETKSQDISSTFRSAVEYSVDRLRANRPMAGSVLGPAASISAFSKNGWLSKEHSQEKMFVLSKQDFNL